MSQRRAHELYRAFNQWGFDERGWAPETRYRRYLCALRAEAWMREHRNRSLVYANADDLRAFLFRTSRDPGTRNNLRAHLIGIFDFFIDQHLAPENYAKLLPRLPQKRSLPKPLTRQQGQHLMLVARSHGGAHEVLIGLFLFAGLRKGEARTLRWPDVSLDAGQIRVMGKGLGGRSKERIIDIPDELLFILKRWREENPHPLWVFPSERLDGPRSNTWIRDMVDEVEVDCGFHVHPHRLRHTYATRLAEIGTPLEVIQELLGHEDPKITRVYVGVVGHVRREWARKLTYRGS